MDWEGYVLLGVALAFGLASPVIFQMIREQRLNRAGLDKLDAMTDEDMLMHMARLCGALGYRVFRPAQQDCGFQLILVDGLGQRRGVVTQNWRKLVDDVTVQQVIAAAQKLDLPAPMVVSVEGYTYKAREAAKAHGTILWSLTELTEAIGRVRQHAMAYPELPSINTLTWYSEGRDSARPGLEPEPKPDCSQSDVVHLAQHHRRRPERLRKGEGWNQDDVPRCPRCGRKMVVRRGAEGDYWGCPLFPRCLGTRPR
jgi:hypothetical protein